MKPSTPLRALLVGSSALLAVPALHAATLYWDGTTSTTNPDGGNGTWDNLTTSNWDNAPFGGADTQWDNTLFDSAWFGPTPASAATTTVSLATGGITTGGITFAMTGHTIQNNTLTFGGTNNTVTLNNAVTAANINSVIGSSSANLTFTAQNPLANHTLTFSGTSTGGWSGTTTVNAGMTLRTLDVDAATDTFNQALRNTSAITINGGTVQVSRHWGGTNLNYVNDSATITVNGGGTLNASSITAGNAAMNENIGAITVNSGQFFIGQPTGGSSGQKLTLSAAPVINGTSTIGYMGALTTTGKLVVTGSAATPAGQIIGPWATAGSNASTQTDFAIYNGSSEVALANIAATAASTWSTTHAATSNYTLANASGSAANGLLANSLNINTLRNTTTATAVTADNAADVINLTGHGFVAGDVVVLGGTTAPAGLTNGVPYYVINPTANTFQLSTSSGGGAALFTANGTAVNIAGGITLPSGMTLGTYGILNGSAAALAIGGNGGTITLPTAAAGNLFVTVGNAQIQIDAPIVNPGTGQALTLVKSGSAALTLRGTNTFTGGIVVNAGSVVVTPSAANGFVTGAAGGDIIYGGNLTYSSANAWGVTGRDVTFNGTGSLTSSVAYTGGTLTVNAGANAQIANTGNLLYATTTGTGTIIHTAGSASSLLNLGNASGFTGNLQNRGLTGGTNTGIQFSSLGDAGALQFAGGNGDSGQAATFTYNGTGTLTFGTRQIQILDRVSGNWDFRDNTLANNSANGGNNWVINTDLLVTGGRASTQFGVAPQTGRLFILSGSNTDANAFNGVISNGTNPNGIGLSKTGAGTWSLGGNNTHTGGTTLTAGRLNINHAGALGTGTFTIGAATFGNTSGAAITNANNNAMAWNGDWSFLGPNNLNLGTGAVTLGGNRTLTIGSVLTVGGAISGAFSIAKGGGGEMVLSGVNSTYTGATSLNQGTLTISKIANLSVNSSLGAPTTAPNGTIGLGSAALSATLKYDGGGDQTNRVINLAGTTGAVAIDQSGTGLLKFTSAFTATGAGSKTLTLTGSTAGTGEIAGAIVNNSGANLTSLAKSGSGTWILSGANTYTGGTTISAGTLQFGKTNSMPATGAVNVGTTATIAVNAGGTGEFTDATSGAGSLGGLLAGVGGQGATVNYTGNVAVGIDTTNATGGSLTYSGTISNVGTTLALTKLGSGNLTLSGDNSYTGATTISAGTLQIGNGSTTGSLSGTTSITNNANLTISRSGLFTQAAHLGAGVPITGSGSLTKAGPGTTILTAANTYTGGTNIAAGTLAFTTGALGSTGAITFTGSSTLGWQSGNTQDVSVRFTPIGADITATFHTDDTGVTFGTPLSGAGSIAKTGSGTITLSGHNTYTGSTTVHVDELNIASTGSLNSGNDLTIGAGGASDFANAGQTLGAVVNSNTSVNALNFSNTTGTVTLASLTGAGYTRFGSEGIVTGGIATGTVTSIGALTASISGGTVSAGSLNSTSVSGGTTTVGGVATIGNMSNGIANLNGATSAITTFNGGTVNLGTTVLSVSDGSSSGAITGPGGSLDKVSAGVLILSGANTYTGTTTISAGILSIGGAGTLGSGSYAGNIVNNATLNYDSSATQTFSGTITGTGTLTKTGSGNLTLSGDNSYSGGTDISGTGSLTVGHANALGGTGTITLATGATLNLANLAVANPIINNGGTITGASSASITQSGGSLTGTVATGSNLSGSIAGSFAATGAIGGSFISTGKLMGTATFAGAVTIAGTHAPGNSPGIETFNAGITYNASSTLEWDFVGDDLSSRGGDYDGVNVTGGNLSIISGASLKLIAVTVDFDNAAWESVRVFSVFDFTSAGSSTGNFALDTTALDPSFSARGGWSVLNNGGDIILTWTPVPEPSTYAALAGLAALGLAWKRRRQRK